MALSAFAHFCKLYSYTVLEQMLKKLRVIFVYNDVFGFKCGFACLSSTDSTSLPGLIVLGSKLTTQRAIKASSATMKHLL